MGEVFSVQKLEKSDEINCQDEEGMPELSPYPLDD
jgi:hypothetical protein